jgi:hypothetical protein
MQKYFYKINGCNTPLIKLIIFLIIVILMFLFITGLLKNIWTVFICLSGFILEEFLHFFLILLFSSTKEVVFRILTIKKIILAFSWIVPSAISNDRKKVVVIFPPLLIVLTGFIYLFVRIGIGNINGGDCIYAFKFCLVSILSLIPMSFLDYKSDYRQFINLKK